VDQPTGRGNRFYAGQQQQDSRGDYQHRDLLVDAHPPCLPQQRQATRDDKKRPHDNRDFVDAAQHKRQHANGRHRERPRPIDVRHTPIAVSNQPVPSTINRRMNSVFLSVVMP
jgi:hypothetical protein